MQELMAFAVNVEKNVAYNLNLKFVSSGREEYYQSSLCRSKRVIFEFGEYLRSSCPHNESSW